MTEHADNCDWHVDQYPWECTCGAIQRKAAMDKLIAQDAEMLTIAWMDGSHRSTKAHRSAIKALKDAARD